MADTYLRSFRSFVLNCRSKRSDGVSLASSAVTSSVTMMARTTATRPVVDTAMINHSTQPRATSAPPPAVLISDVANPAVANATLGTKIHVDHQGRRRMRVLTRPDSSPRASRMTGKIWAKSAVMVGVTPQGTGVALA